MNRRALALSFISVLLLTMVSVTQIVSLTDANPDFMKSHYCNFSIQSPQHLTTYDTENILLNFTAKTQWNMPPSYPYFYSLDGQDLQSSVEIKNVKIVGTENITDDTILPYIETTLWGQAELSGLSNGPHSIRVFYGQYLANGTIYAHLEGSETVWFFVGTADASSVSSFISEPTFVSPENRTYNSNILSLNVSVYWFFADVGSMSYSVDGKSSYSLSLEKPESESFSHMDGTVIGAVVLPELAEGQHSMTVQVEGTGYFPELSDIVEQATIYFTVDVAPPVISGLSVENKTYSQLDLPLEFAVNEPASWLGYSLDSEANVTLSGNSTLTLNEGVHSIVVYAEDVAGNIAASETIYFTIEKPFPTTLLAASIASVAIVGVGLLFYFKKSKR